MSKQLHRRIVDMLKERGWKFLRHGGCHDIWVYPPNGAQQSVPYRGSDAPRLFQNYLREVKHREKQ
jgi:predicted RNA binding protein YcfA (HicA-like mRNA interferase family)